MVDLEKEAVSDAAPEQAQSTGKVHAAVGSHVEAVTRFDQTDLAEVETERQFSLALALQLDQSVTFSIVSGKGPGRLAQGIDKFSGAAATQQALAERIAAARAGAPTALKRWAADDSSTYRRLLTPRAAFLHAPVAAGYEHACVGCNGACQVTCNACHGRGRNDCGSCHGSGKRNCYRCHGSKRYSCTSCGGRGSWTDYIQEQHWDSSSGQYVHSTRTQFRSCSQCSGSGSETCHSCDWSGKIACSGCGGRGELDCVPCRASGRVDCRDCLATGIQHVHGHVEAAVARAESLEIETADTALAALIHAKIPLADLPSHGELLGVRHDSGAAFVAALYRLRLDVRQARLLAAGRQFDIAGFGPAPTVYDYANIAGHMLQDDLAMLEGHVRRLSRWGIRRSTGLLEAAASFLRSELNMLIAEKVADTGAAPNAAALAVEAHFRGLVDADYVARSANALRTALARVYGDEVLEPGAYLCALAAMAGAAMAALQQPAWHPVSAGLAALGGAGLAWLVLEAITKRRIGRGFDSALAARVLAQLRANGSIRRWRIGVGASAAAMVALAMAATLALPPVREMHGERQALANAQATTEQWFSQSASDWRQRSYPSRSLLEREAQANNWRAQMILGWQLLLGAGGVAKDPALAGTWFDKAEAAAGNSPVWKSAKAIQTLHQEATPEQLRAASAALRNAADGADFTEARYWEARTYLDPRSPVHDMGRGIRTLTRAADKRHAHAALMLGQRYAKGDGVKQHPQRARQYLQIAAQGGLAEAEQALAELK